MDLMELFYEIMYTTQHIKNQQVTNISGFQRNENEPNFGEFFMVINGSSCDSL